MKHSLSRPVGRCDVQRKYNLFYSRYSPVDFGIPTSGLRVYSWFHLAGVVKLKLSSLNESTFRLLFFRQLNCDARVYLKIDDSILLKNRLRWAEEQGLTLSSAATDSVSVQLESTREIGPFCDPVFRQRLRRKPISQKCVRDSLS